LRKIAQAAADRGIKFVSAYVFSTENWERTQEEVDYLMDLVVWVAAKEIDKFVADDFKMVFLGSRKRLSRKVLEAIDSAEKRTAGGKRAVLALCLNYGGQMELAEGVARMIGDGVTAKDVTPEKIEQYLYHPEVPPVDLMIRTAGERRLSGFMLWRVSYAELYFAPQLWPAFSEAELDAALDEYAHRQRRFGK
jgi:undecaprenyl diphosphate synthase